MDISVILEDYIEKNMNTALSRGLNKKSI